MDEKLNRIADYEARVRDMSGANYDHTRVCSCALFAKAIFILTAFSLAVVGGIKWLAL